MNFKEIKEVWDCTKEEWQDWEWQLENSITKVKELKDKFDITDEQLNTFKEAAEIFPMAITPYYASLIDFDDKYCPIKLQAVPSKEELKESKVDMDDPLHEDADSPVDGLTHRYPDRVLLLVTNKCSMFCRHCTRKRKVGDDNSLVDFDQIEKGIEYIKETPEVRDVLISGGDPLLLDTDLLEKIIVKLKEISHVEIVRIGSRTPVVLPQRIDDELINMLKKHKPIFMNTHFNHKKELTDAAKRAVNKLVDAGVPLGNQTVLLRNLNDTPKVIKELNHELVKNRIKPYYLYQCDLSRGIEHFRTSVSTGINIMESLIGHTSGFARPEYVVDAPGGGGKIPVGPDYIVSSSKSKTVLRNYEGVITTYTEPKDSGDESKARTYEEMNEVPKEERKVFPEKLGVHKLLSDENDKISLKF
ncbi:lysine 2,3-aminomutase [Sporohalobacter salinus]|uniref:lysine 2,3-aminomutase n=1 Tax=Sporohalobacter salinus TaxID=1494606 RepID=UPI0019604571|nr:lysine 2,3-aminomutase [Sporohalobacter salinus]MBM7622627.1 lysine 2,3-aminomutase [Sporohalobacter salinus]